MEGEFAALMPNHFGGIVEYARKNKIAAQACFGTRSSLKKKDPQKI